MLLTCQKLRGAQSLERDEWVNDRLFIVPRPEGCQPCSHNLTQSRDALFLELNRIVTSYLLYFFNIHVCIQHGYNGKRYLWYVMTYVLLCTPSCSVVFAASHNESTQASCLGNFNGTLKATVMWYVHTCAAVVLCIHVLAWAYGCTRTRRVTWRWSSTGTMPQRRAGTLLSW